jgi:hypothetical protein
VLRPFDGEGVRAVMLVLLLMALIAGIGIAYNVGYGAARGSWPATIDQTRHRRSGSMRPPELVLSRAFVFEGRLGGRAGELPVTQHPPSLTGPIRGEPALAALAWWGPRF